MLEGNGEHASSSRAHEEGVNVVLTNFENKNSVGQSSEDDGNAEANESVNGSKHEMESDEDEDSVEDEDEEREMDDDLGVKNNFVTNEVEAVFELNGSGDQRIHLKGESKSAEQEHGEVDEDSSDDVDSGEIVSSEDDSEDDDDEPVLKYERFSNTAHDLLQKDSASVVAVSTKYIVSILTAHDSCYISHRFDLM